MRLIIFLFLMIFIISCQSNTCITLQGKYEKWGVEGGLTYCLNENSPGTATFTDENGQEVHLVPEATLQAINEKLREKNSVEATSNQDTFLETCRLLD